MRREDVIRLIRERDMEIRAFGVRHLSLFGSVARDTAGPASDVDILVEFEGPVTFRQHMGLLVFLEGLFGARVDLATPPMLPPELTASVNADMLRVA